jgi:hypothetical protein
LKGLCPRCSHACGRSSTPPLPSWERGKASDASDARGGEGRALKWRGSRPTWWSCTGIRARRSRPSRRSSGFSRRGWGTTAEALVDAVRGNVGRY